MHRLTEAGRQRLRSLAKYNSKSYAVGDPLNQALAKMGLVKPNPSGACISTSGFRQTYFITDAGRLALSDAQARETGERDDEGRTG